MITVPENKEPQHAIESERFLKPKLLHLPLSQHAGVPSRVLVKAGDIVEEGQPIAEAAGFISSFLHAPANAKVKSIDTCNHPLLNRTPGIILEPNYEIKRDYSYRSDANSLKPEQLLEIIDSSGIVGLGGAAFPTHVKLRPPKKINTLIINGCECEPYLACDNRLMLEELPQLLKGIEIAGRIIEPSEIIVALEDNKPEAISHLEAFRKGATTKKPRTRVVSLKSSYPQGGEKQLIYSCLKRKVPSQKLPLDVGCLVLNVATCFALYEAVHKQKPLIERMVGFYGNALTQPKNIWVKIGTSLKELFDEKILEFKDEPSRIICGGPMMGIAIDSLEVPITKASGGFLFLYDDKPPVPETACIRCGRCVTTCPMGLLPLEYVKYAKASAFGQTNSLYVNDCIECGCCSWGCPAKIPIVHYIKLSKRYAPKN